MSRITRWPLIITLAVGALLGGCDSPQSWGVLLWSPDESAVPSGELVEIRGSSQLHGTVTFRPQDSNRSIETQSWRVSSFNRRRDAEALAVSYSGWSNRYGVATLDGLRVRGQPEADAVQMYKLRLGEAVKILSRGEAPVDVGTYRGYWYEVVTAEGARGYTFDQFLQITSLEELTAGDETEESDEFLERFFTTVFRPDYFRDMVRSGRYDLSRFLPEYGIFAGSSSIEIVREDHTSTIEYQRITRPTADSYAFETSSLILFVKSTNWINLIYSDSGVRYSEDYVYFPDDIEALTAAEVDRRGALFESLIARGTILESSAYGTITFAEERTFTWEGYDRLVPEVITPGAAAAGRVEFPLFLDSAAAARYEGAIVLDFARDDSIDRTEPVAFAYTYVNDGIRFVYVPAASIDGNLVAGSGLSSIIIFFTLR